MLVLHQSSRCDVCLSEYSWERLGKRPYAIACGHIFCSDCLLANTPPQCPLCRKTYQPNKIKKLHVDKPENIDDHKEVDLLQRLAISWEAPPDQTKDLLSEIDFWLRDRSDEACIALRKSRAALSKHRELKATENDYRDTIDYLDQEVHRLKEAVEREKTKCVIQAEGYTLTMKGMAKEITRLTIQVKVLESNINPLTGQPRNPLPRPPEPIPTDQIPTFEQAVSEAGVSSGRFSERPLSPYANNSSESPSYRDRSRYDNNPRMSAPHTQASHYVDPHIPKSSPFYDPNPSYSTRLGMRTQFDNTNQPLDAYALVETYTRAYTTGLVNGKELALGRQMAETDLDNRHRHRSEGSGSNDYQSPYSGQPTTSIYEQQNSVDRTSNTYQDQPYSAPPVDVPTRDRQFYRRQPTATSIISSSTSARSSPRPPSRGSRSSSDSGSANRESTAMALTQHYSSPLLANILSNPSTIIGPSATSELPAVSPQPHAPNSSSSSSRNTLHISNAPISPRTYDTTPVSPRRSVTDDITSSTRDRATNHDNTSSSGNHRSSSPSGQSRRSGTSANTWGTLQSIDSILTRGSFPELELLAFRGPREHENDQRRPSYDVHGSEHDGTNASARASFSDGSSEVSGRSRSPARPVQSMVGVLPREETGASSYYSPGQRQEAMSNHRSPTIGDRERHPENNDSYSGDSRRRIHGSDHVASSDSPRSRAGRRDTAPSRSSLLSHEASRVSHYSPSSLDARVYGGWVSPQGTHHQSPNAANNAASSGLLYSANPQSVWGVSSPPRHQDYPRVNRITSNISLPDDSPIGSPHAYSNENGHYNGSLMSQMNSPQLGHPTMGPLSARSSYGNALGLSDFQPNANPVSPRNIPVSGSWAQEH